MWINKTITSERLERKLGNLTDKEIKTISDMIDYF